MPPKIYPSHSTLNKIERPIVVERVDLNPNTAPVSILKSVVNKTFKVDSLSNTGPYKAVVLRVEDNSKPIPGSWVSSVFSQIGLFSTDTIPRFVEIKARIPEIHAALPIPSTIGNDSQEHDIIELYPTFIAEKDSLPIPAIGSLVWVTFGNKTNFTDPIYLGPVVTKQQASPPREVSRGSDSFGALCNEMSLQAPATGQKLPSVALSTSRTGKTLLTRQNLKVPNKILKGERFSLKTIEDWGKALKGQKLGGLSWIGNIVYNGYTDTNHKEGKRDTIIFAHSLICFDSPIEICYFFHDVGEFSYIDFSKRIAPAISKLIAEKRNIVLVIPELPWSGNTGNALKNLNLGTDDSLYYSHEEVVKVLKKYFSSSVNIQQITLLGFAVGANVVHNSRISLGAMQVNKISLSNVTTDILKDIAEETSKYTLELNIFSQTSGLSSNVLNSLDVKKYKNILTQKLSKSKEELGSYILTYLNKQNEESVRGSLDSQVDKVVTDIESEEAESAFNVLQNISNATTSALYFPDPTPPPTVDWNISPYVVTKKSSNTLVVAASPYEENRVYLKDYGSLTGNESILVNVPSVGTQQKVHKLVADRLFEMNRAWKQEYPAREIIKIISGWRPKKTMSEEEFNNFLKSKYGSVEEGKKYQAYGSPHETGLAFDIGNNGLTPNSKTNELQKNTELHKWLVKNAYKFGFTPYKHEVWHYECRITKEAWATGKEFTNETYAVKVEEIGENEESFSYGKMSGVSKNCIQTIGSNNMSGSNTSDTLEILWNGFAKGAQENVGKLASTGKKVLDKYGDAIEKYRGGCPASVVAVRAAHESGGNASAPPTKCCGETGILAVWCSPSFARDKVTMDAGTLGSTCNGKLKGKFDPFDPAQNLWCGLSDLGRRAYNLKQKYGELFPEPNEQFWFLVMAEMNIGKGALAKLLSASNPRNGYALTDLNNWVYSAGSDLQKYSSYFGSQSPALIARRILVLPVWVEAAKQLGTLVGDNFGYASFPEFTG